MLKIVTYNVNGIRQRIAQYGSLLKLLDSLDADIICFQEIKVTRQELTADLIIAEGYESFFSCTRTTGRGRTGYSGVATFCRVKLAFSSPEVALPVAAEEGFTGLLETPSGSESRSGKPFWDMECLEEFSKDELLKIDSEGRCVITDHGHFVLFNVYGPRADPDDMERVQFKANFYKIMQKRWELLQREKRRIIVVGDLNIAPSAIDRCEAGPDFEKNEFRRWFRSLLVKEGGSFYDLFREKHPERIDAYTCWPVHTGGEEFNFGSRIDHILASGICLHHIDENDDHNLVVCHVEECDVMTQFRRWKPGISSRWKGGGRATKLEGSDHAPVFVTLKEVPDTKLHCTPPLSARYMPEIRGSQQTIASIFLKRQMTQRVSTLTSPTTIDDTENVDLVGSVKGTLSSCSVSRTQSNTLSSPMMNVCKNDPDTSKEMQDEATAGHRSVGSTLDVRKRKKMKQNQQSQRSLTSFFHKIPNSCDNVESSTKDVSDNPESTLVSSDCAKEATEIVNKESGFDELASSQQNNALTVCCLENDKNSVALMEWQRIQQLMQDSIPLCEGHHEPCVARVVKKPGPNFGRRFYVCARAEGPSSNPETRCDFFRWAGSKARQKK